MAPDSQYSTLSATVRDQFVVCDWKFGFMFILAKIQFRPHFSRSQPPSKMEVYRDKTLSDHATLQNV